ncbi:BolA/IbaG family iron-sulfur metabolism protein [Pseudoxanthomonas sp.]|jgi:BolA protein|uniref:BolA family protein n=1 Tax=Pseudoxanthomonas sp. TaxID=1871049 RepID=UPI0025D5C407|nr:BolA/IbaG family iron-sulfur metabolism protein [Pseudoxanthomonas sp.]
MTAASLQERMRALLESAFAPCELRIHDNSAQHAGHAGAAEGGHYQLWIRSPRFKALAPLARHRAVYAALAPLMGNGIHALGLQTLAPGETEG